MENPALRAQSITKRYKETLALDHFSIELPENRIYGLLGRNGAGKTTLLNILTSRIFADEGSVEIFGQPAVENPHVLPDICYMLEKNTFTPKMKVQEILSLAQTFYPHYDADYADALCKRFRLLPSKRYHQLSRGYESILRIVVGLASRAPLTIFDEPVLGIDAAVRDDFYRALIEDFTEHPRTVIVSTHLIEESADIFSDIIMIKEGHFIGMEPVETLKASAFSFSGRAEAVEQALAGCSVIHRETVGSVLIASVYEKLPPERMREIRAAGIDVAPIPIQKLFIYLTDPQEGGVLL